MSNSERKFVTLMTIRNENHTKIGSSRYNGSLLKNFTFIFILLKVSSITCLKELESNTLEPEKTLYNEVMLHNETRLYSLKKLNPNAVYEIRVSYPASVPTEFTIHVDVPNESSSFQSRHLLNIDKATFKTESNTQGYVAEVIAHRTGFPYNPERHNDPVVFNICLEALHFGLSRNSWKMVCYVVILCAISFKYLAPLAHRFILGDETKRKHQS